MSLVGENVSGQGPSFSLVIPFYNEEASAQETVSDLVVELGGAARACELILVDNGSRDGTGDILRRFADKYPWIRVATVEVNEGYGWGILCGLRAATASYVGFMAGDGQIDPTAVAQIYQRLIEEKLDLCKAVRVVRHDGFKRKLMSRVYNWAFSLLFQTQSRDINATPKLMRRQCYEQLAPTSKDWFIDAELMIKAHKKGYQMGEVKIETHGRSRSSVQHTTFPAPSTWGFSKRKT